MSSLSTHRLSLRDLSLAMLCAGTLALGAAAPAQAERPLISKKALSTKEVPGGSIEGACGVAVSSGTIYVSDYYHRAIDTFTIGGAYEGQISGDPLDGSCGLASSQGGALYANDWHQSVSRVLPSSLAFDPEGESTGVAVDQGSGDVYVDDRNHIAVYEPSGTPIMEIGLSTLGEGYGVAAESGRVYVPDAADDTVKIYEPGVDPINPVGVLNTAAAPGGRFNSLVDAAIAIDPSNGHVLVIDDLQPGFEHPEAAIDEFGAGGEFLSRLPQRVVDGEPTGIVVNNSTLYVTSGNDEEANMFTFGPYTGPAPMVQAPSSQAVQQAVPAATQSALPDSPTAQSATPALRLSSGAVDGEGATISVLLPGPGTLAVSGRGLHRQRWQAGAGKRTIHLRLSPAGSRALSRSKLGKLEVRVRVALVPKAGATLSASKAVIFKNDEGEAR